MKIENDKNSEIANLKSEIKTFNQRMKTLLINSIINGKTQNLLIENGLIAYIGKDMPAYETLIDLQGKTLIPGMIDPHVHVRDLGQTDKEDWLSASMAAVAGGITMLFDMPNNKPPTVNLKNLNLKREVAQKSLVHYKFNIAVTEHNLDDVKEILDTNPDDVSALKLFLAGSSANEYVENIETVKRIFDLSLRYDLPVIIHTELQKCIEKYQAKVQNPTVLDHNYIRNRECANRGTELVVNLAKEIGNAVYIAHTSTAEEINIIRQNKDKARIYCEVTPHHLLLEESILQKAGNFGKVNPPIRSKADNQALWLGIADGTVDTIGTDHAPHKISEKSQAYSQAPSGFPGLETVLPLLLNEVNKGNLSMAKLVELTSTNTAKIFKIDKHGAIRPGNYADLTVIDMNKQWKIEPKKFMTKAKYSPFAEFEGIGMPVGVFINGELKVEVTSNK